MSEPVAANGTYQQLANYLVSGYWSWAGGGPRSWSSIDITFNYEDLAQADRDMVDMALALWDDVGNLNFHRTTGTANITFINDFAGAYCQSSVSGTTLTSATVNVSTSWAEGVGAGFNSYRFQTFMHEIGHALGLGHQGPYNGSANYPSDAAYDNDSWQLSLMSYFDQIDNTSVSGSYAFALTAQLVDIIAIQDIYGTPAQTRTSDTVYGVGNNTGRPVYGTFSDFNFPTVTIYDDGGIDTLNYSGTNQNQFINLAPGSFSSVYGEVNNIIIYTTTLIENAVAGNGNDSIYGNQLANLLQGMGGNDSLFGGFGDDIIFGNDGDDALVGEAGNDQLIGGTGHDSLWGHDGNDLLKGEDGNDTLDAGNGSDNLYGGSGNDVLIGMAGADSLYGEAGSDTCYGGNDDDGIFGLGENDTLHGEAGNDQIWGGLGDDVLTGGDGGDTLRGETGNDFMWGGNHADLLIGAAGNDTMNGEHGDDRFSGGDGNDFMSGGDGADQLEGDQGSDTIFGGNHNDVLVGGTGNDTLRGDHGSDTFFFTAGFGNDIIVDFSPGAALDDVLVFAGVGGPNLNQNGANLHLNFGVHGEVILANVHFSQLNSNDIIYA